MHLLRDKKLASQIRILMNKNDSGLPPEADTSGRLLSAFPGLSCNPVLSPRVTSGDRALFPP